MLALGNDEISLWGVLYSLPADERDGKIAAVFELLKEVPIVMITGLVVRVELLTNKLFRVVKSRGFMGLPVGTELARKSRAERRHPLLSG